VLGPIAISTREGIGESGKQVPISVQHTIEAPGRPSALRLISVGGAGKPRAPIFPPSGAALGASLRSPRFRGSVGQQERPQRLLSRFAAIKVCSNQSNAPKPAADFFLELFGRCPRYVAGPP
jgi:hypothetical protein